MTYRRNREVVDGVENISLGSSEADGYLKFVRDRCRLNTVLSYGYDLQIFLNSIQKPVLEITPLDILAFIESQQSAYNRQGSTNGLSAKGPGLSNTTIKRRLAAVAGFYEYISVYHNRSEDQFAGRRIDDRQAIGVVDKCLPSSPVLLAHVSSPALPRHW